MDAFLAFLHQLRRTIDNNRCIKNLSCIQILLFFLVGQSIHYSNRYFLWHKSGKLASIRELTQRMVVFRGVDFAMIPVHVIQWVDQDVVEHSSEIEGENVYFSAISISLRLFTIQTCCTPGESGVNSIFIASFMLTSASILAL